LRDRDAGRTFARMATEQLDDTNFQTRLAEADLAIVDFYAGWCGPCMLFKPKFARLSESYPNVAFFVCDGENAPESRKTIEIPSLPYFGLFRKGAFVRGFSTTKEEGFREELELEIGKP
jgi:thiol-disulfide isomerase/thioredoxin